jgi:uncharacterized protein (DUF302 family)
MVRNVFLRGAGLFCLSLFSVGHVPRAAMAEPMIKQNIIQIDHVTIESQKSFDEVRAAIERSIPQLDAKGLAQVEKGEIEAAKATLERGPELSIFLTRNHGSLLLIAGQTHKALQYEIGNPLTASRMTRHNLSAALYAPLRVLLYENGEGHAVFEYDKPSSLFGQFGDEHVLKVARELDQSLERALVHAAQ